MKMDMIFEKRGLELTQEALLLSETLFHNANGYIGVRSNFEEGYPEEFTSIRGTYINGVYDITRMKQAEALCGLMEEKQTMLNVADTQGICLNLDGEEFSLFTGKVLSSRRYLNMEAGVSTREVVWESPKGKQIQLEIKRMTSFECLNLFTIEYKVEAINWSGQITLTSALKGEVKKFCDPSDPRVAGESETYLKDFCLEEKDGAAYLTSQTVTSGITMCCGVKNICEKASRRHLQKEGTAFTETIYAPIVLGESVTLVKWSVFCDSLREKNPRTGCEKLLNEAVMRTLPYWYEVQKTYLRHFWDRCDMEIGGDRELNQAVHYNMYVLLQSAGKDCYSNIAAKGLSGEGYEGHYFWDTEMYLQPFFTITVPEISKSLISYRYHILPEAKENAKILGHKKGALYPWRTIMGRECSGYFPSGTAQYHINGDIAYSIVAYYLATGDEEFMEEKGVEILVETARLWMDCGHFYKGKFQIHCVTGPDEYTCVVNNNYFTNAVAQYNLLWAARWVDRLAKSGKLAVLFEKTGITAEEAAGFKGAAAAMFFPYDSELDLNPQDDSFLSKKVWDFAGTPPEHKPLLLYYHPLTLYRYQICKQADTVLAHILFEDKEDLSTRRNTLHYYEKITTHDSSLSACAFSIAAARLGETEKAYGYFGDSAKLDLFNTHHNTKDGIHAANMGGGYMAVVYGFGGLRIKEDGIHLAPSLPEAWKDYRFRFSFHGSTAELYVNEKEVVLRLLEGEGISVYLYEVKYQLSDVITVTEKQRKCRETK